jgi:hypothetical protein
LNLFSRIPCSLDLLFFPSSPSAIALPSGSLARLDRFGFSTPAALSRLPSPSVLRPPLGRAYIEYHLSFVLST